jgi:hypothetical protein
MVTGDGGLGGLIPARRRRDEEAQRPRGLVEQRDAAIQVTGDGRGHLEFRKRPFGHRELAPGFRRLKAEGLTPERLTTEPVTRHLE